MFNIMPKWTINRIYIFISYWYSLWRKYSWIKSSSTIKWKRRQLLTMSLKMFLVFNEHWTERINVTVAEKWSSKVLTILLKHIYTMINGTKLLKWYERLQDTMENIRSVRLKKRVIETHIKIVNEFLHMYRK